ncbi:acyl-CoA dehydrogenase family protein [Nocardia stercoris]|uniref:Acyl-CoA dehydrogenase n=1 Tax=Nocardia stercoris TaxID=2483361 RepID=A0A3M2L6F3_9NOCA|nr:acyl-CoA dehydrogenase family protein [Nocardia stercoris]RMI31495.1 acyl-CoA dehydrogenase [Nocardia stercoris]
MRRTLYTDDHEAYRTVVREYLQREVVPHMETWDEQHLVDRAAIRSAARNGVFALWVPEEYGGSGETDYRYQLVVKEEIARTRATSFGFTIGMQDDIILHYLLALATDEQKRRWLPGFATGDIIGAIAMTEPGTGSDLQGIKTTAVRAGDSWIINGQKTFISCGTSADIVVVAARTDAEAGSRGFSLFVVERGTPGFRSGSPLRKLGLQGQDTSELFFDDVVVPAANLLGTEGQGLIHLMANLVPERLGVIAGAYSDARAIFDQTVAYVKERKAFGKPLGGFQNTRFVLAELATELDVAEAYVDNVIRAYNAGELTPIDAAKGKWYLSDLQNRVIDRCLQLHGGYGFMMEYPVARAYADARIQSIYAGTNEIMKEIIGRELTGSR